MTITALTEDKCDTDRKVIATAYLRVYEIRHMSLKKTL